MNTRPYNQDNSPLGNSPPHKWTQGCRTRTIHHHTNAHKAVGLRQFTTGQFTIRWFTTHKWTQGCRTRTIHHWTIHCQVVHHYANEHKAVQPGQFTTGQFTTTQMNTRAKAVGLYHLHQQGGTWKDSHIHLADWTLRVAAIKKYGGELFALQTHCMSSLR